MGLYDGILIKDNHLAALRSRKDGAEFHAVQAVLNIGCSVPVEIEVDDLGQFDLALGFAELILLDNMPLGDLREAVRRRNAKAPHVPLEASGGITLDTVRAVAETGVDRISIGALTHSAPALDIALDYLT
jgi:nicotinate-nucleotide pyrophosphorylase (carboxylating)